MKLFRVAIAEKFLGLVQDASLPRIAEDALLEGYESLYLGALAGVTEDEFNPFAINDLYRQALKELSLTVPSYGEAVYVVLHYYVRGIATGELSALAGVIQIKDVFDSTVHNYPSRKMVGDGLGIEAFVGLYYEITDLKACQERAVRPSASEEELFVHYEKEIIRAAQAFDLDGLRTRILDL